MSAAVGSPSAYQLLSLRAALRLWARTGIRPSRTATPTRLVRQVERVLGTPCLPGRALRTRVSEAVRMLEERVRRDAPDFEFSSPEPARRADQTEGQP